MLFCIRGEKYQMVFRLKWKRDHPSSCHCPWRCPDEAGLKTVGPCCWALALPSAGIPWDSQAPQAEVQGVPAAGWQLSCPSETSGSAVTRAEGHPRGPCRIFLVLLRWFNYADLMNVNVFRESQCSGQSGLFLKKERFFPPNSTYYLILAFLNGREKITDVIHQSRKEIEWEPKNYTDYLKIRKWKELKLASQGAEK